MVVAGSRAVVGGLLILAVACGPTLTGSGGDTSSTDSGGSDATSASPGASHTGGSADASSTGEGDETTGSASPPAVQTWTFEHHSDFPVHAFCDVAARPDGSVFVSGTGSVDINAEQIGGAGWLARLDANGELVDIVDLPEDHAPLSLSVDPSGRIFMVGTRGTYPSSGEHFFALWNDDLVQQWVDAENSGWGFWSCATYWSGLADGAALDDGTLVARHEHAGSTVRIFDPTGIVRAEENAGGSVHDFHTIAVTGPDTFAVLGERSPTVYGDDWVVRHYDTAGAVLWEQTAPGIPGSLIAVESEPWHFFSGPPGGEPTLHRHSAVDGAFTTADLPSAFGVWETACAWAGSIVTVQPGRDELTAWTPDLDPVWTLDLDVPPPELAGSKLIPGADGALYLVVGQWMTKIVLGA